MIKEPAAQTDTDPRSLSATMRKSSSVSSRSRSNRCAAGRKMAPCRVRITERVDRSNICRPISSSSTFIDDVSVDCVTCRLSAALVKLPSAATAMNARICFKVIFAIDQID